MQNQPACFDDKGANIYSLKTQKVISKTNVSM